MIPRATYRLQFHKGFGFDQATEIIPYLAKLGVSHIYASPWLKARPGSTHGYDIVDHQALNPELGNQASFERMVSALRANGLGQILDFVPNHMGVGGADNPLWLDVLEWGPDSDCAGWFDIDWDADQSSLPGKLLVPFLGGQYGRELHDGKLLLKLDENDGSFAVWAYDTHKLPICPFHYSRILGDGDGWLERLGDEFSNLQEWHPQVPRRARELKQRLAVRWHESDEIRAAIQRSLYRLNGIPGDENSWRSLNALIANQHWRPAYFRAAADDINYRRFFNINDLAGLRMELPDVFDHAHKLVIKLLQTKTIDGLRIDHIDGLLDPTGYLEGLRASVPRPEDDPFYLIVEKILAQHESLRTDWPVQGTTGYEFANLVSGLLIDPAGEEGLTRTWMEFTGSSEPFSRIVHESKQRIMRNEMVSELNVLAREAARVARENPLTTDFTKNLLHRAIREVVACFPVYRTYLDDAGASADDLRDLDWAIKQARANEPELDPEVFDFLRNILSGELMAEGHRSGYSRLAVQRFGMKLQQYSGPVMAKGLEDTAFYRYHRLIALNEVGGYPDRFGVNIPAFHKANAQRAKFWPDSMLGTSSHDTKRGEDVRARLAVLSEIPEEWSKQVNTWSRLLRARRADIEGLAPPDRNDEYLFYQLLAGSWPAELMGLETLDAQQLRNYAERVKSTMVKSIREAKINSRWEAPDKTYEEAVCAFIDDALNPEHSQAFFALFLPFEQKLAKPGMDNSLIQAALKLTVPGVPDFYQGSELWNLSLVDPDNRRPVDYGMRREMLTALQSKTCVRDLYEHWNNGTIKLFLTTRLLHFRSDHAALFARGDYEPIVVNGDQENRVCAFARTLADDRVLVAIARFPARLVSPADLSGVTFALPDSWGNCCWRNLLTDSMLSASANLLVASEVFRELPVAVLAPMQPEA